MPRRIWQYLTRNSNNKNGTKHHHRFAKCEVWMIGTRWSRSMCLMKVQLYRLSRQPTKDLWMKSISRELWCCGLSLSSQQWTTKVWEAGLLSHGYFERKWRREGRERNGEEEKWEVIRRRCNEKCTQKLRKWIVRYDRTAHDGYKNR